MTLTIPLKKLDKELPVPENAYAGDGAVDLRSTKNVVLKPFERALIPTGIAIELPWLFLAAALPSNMGLP